VLIDTGDNPDLGSWWRRNHVEFMRHLKATLAEEQCELDMILVTHLHTGLLLFVTVRFTLFLMGFVGLVLYLPPQLE